MADTIDRQDIINQFNSQYANKIGYVWHSGNVPSYADGSLFGTKPSVSVNDISSSNPITGSTIANNLKSMAQRFTSIRNCRRILTSTTNGVVTTTADETQLSAMNNNYRQSMGGSVATPNPITTLNLTDLYNNWSACRNNTVTLTYNTYTQHSSHSSRSRR